MAAVRNTVEGGAFNCDTVSVYYSVLILILILLFVCCCFCVQVECCIDWMWVFVVVCMKPVSDFSSIACGWTLMKNEGLVECMKIMDTKRYQTDTVISNNYVKVHELFCLMLQCSRNV